MLTLQVLNDTFVIHRYAAGSMLPMPVLQADGFLSITRTEDELSIVCSAELTLDSDQSEGEWAALKVLGPLDFALTGILAGLAATLAQIEVSIFAISTYDTDYLLVKTESLNKAIDGLAAAGYTIVK